MAVEKHREYWADYTKGFAIWLMVLCHFGLRPHSLVNFIYVFHMPVFFLISGYFEKESPFTLKLLKHNFNRLIVPYFFFSLCSFSICWISPYIHPEIYHYGNFFQTFIKAFIGMILMEDMVRPYAFMPTGALWFLIALFIIKILFSLLCLCWKECKILIILIIIIGYLTVNFKIPFFSLDSSFLSLPFYIVGFFLNKYQLINKIKNRWTLLLLSIISWLYVSIIGVRNGRIDIDGCITGNNIILFYINGIIGSLACIYTFKLLDYPNHIFQRIGSSTLTILGTHGYINKLTTLLAVLLLGVSSSEIPIWWIVTFSILSLIFGIWIEGLLIKYCPRMIGKNNENKN